MLSFQPLWMALLGIGGVALLSGAAPPVASARGPRSVGGVLRGRPPYAASAQIQHVVIIFQENRSFDDMFYNFPGADTATGGYNSHGQFVPLASIPLEAGYDIDHTSGAFFTACDGTGSIPGTNCKMDGFDLEYSQSHNSNSQYGYVPATESKPYFNMASQYVLGD
ncbi:MAG: hypothetical protein JO060_07020, partial [Candidatus Eremiobacteraeota bacterium]|nr:hypothetical protein [Candidatus Eremiobacteraeota bacterium]